MAKYSYITDKTHNNRKIQVESAKRDGSGKNIENNYAKQNGNYQSLTAGLSNNFDTKKVMVDESAYNFRPTATMGSVELEVGSPCKVKKIVGGSVAFNQLMENGNFANSDYWNVVSSTLSVSNNVGTLTRTNATDILAYHTIGQVVKDHKYLISGEAKSSVGGTLVFSNALGFSTTLVADTWKKFGGIVNENVTYQSIALRMNITSSIGDTLQLKNIQLIDLTQMFGSTIADYIYSLEQANEGSGVAWFKRYFPKEYYAYNGGELVSVKTQGKKITRFNQWDEEWELGELNPSTGGTDSSNSRIRSKNFIKVLPSTAYYIQFNTTTLSTGRIACYDANNNYLGQSGGWLTANSPTMFTTPSNCHYIKFVFVGTTYNHDICINFHYDGERDGEYEPYNSETYPCDDIELRGIPQLDENNNLAFDGDEYANDGNVTRKYGIVDLGTLNWNYLTGTNRGDYFRTQLVGLAKPIPFYQYVLPNWVCPKYVVALNTAALLGVDKIIATDYDPQQPTKAYILIKDSAYTDPATFKTAMSGVYLVYELATTTDENSIPFTEVQECDNWGTEEWLAPTTDTRPCEVPVGHETDYLPDLKAKLEVAPNTPNENGVYVMEHNASGNTYTLIGAWLNDNGYVKPTAISGYDNTKTQTLKNVEGVLTWVDDE